MGIRERLLLNALGAGYAASLHGAHRRFREAARLPLRAQSATLLDLLSRNAGTEFGRRHRFGQIRSVCDYQKTVPIARYEDFEADILRIADGAQGVLTEEPVLMMERTSGSTRGPKLIPYTKGLLRDFGAFTDPWLYDLYLHRPRLIGTTSYWSVSPVGRAPEVTPGGLPVGFSDDTEYFGPLARFALRRLLTVPKEVAQLSMEDWRFETARRLLEDERLGFISVWNPSFLLLLLDYIEAEREWLIAALSPKRRKVVARALAGHHLAPRMLWPRLQLVSSWADGEAARPWVMLRMRLPGIEFQAKGLLATEGAVSFPLLSHADGAVIPASGPFMELLDLEDEGAPPRLIHELERGRRYSPVLTTAGGLYRYRLMDIVECTGHLEGLPLVRFAGRLDQVSDLVGEKVSAGEVEAALEAARSRLQVRPHFTLLAPVAELPGRYELYVEGADDQAEAMAALVEASLYQGHHYRYARDLGQLDSVRAVVVKNGSKRYLEALADQGAKLGDIKPQALDRRTIWHEVFRT